MTVGNEIIRRRPRAGKRPLGCISSSLPLSVGKLCLLSIALVTIGTQAPLATAKSFPIHHLHHLRGGSSSPSDEINDQELDEYIDFLLAYADNKATEEDNPLFKGEDPGLLLENLEESSPVEEEAMESAEILEPLVDDVNNETQIDAMVETLVASVDDKDLEDEEEEVALEVTDSVATTIETPPIEMEESVAPVEVSTPVIAEEEEEQVDESESFFLGSSAVDNMPPPVAVEETTAEVTTSEQDEPEKLSLFSSFMQKIGLKKEEEVVTESAESEEMAVEPVESIEEQVPVELEEPVAETVDADIETPVVESSEAIDETSESVEEPVIECVTVSQPEVEVPPLEEAVDSEDETPKPDRMKQLMAPFTAAATATKTGVTAAFDSTKTSITTAVGATQKGVTTAFNATKTGVTTAFDSTKTGMTTAIDATRSGVTAAIDGTKTGVTTAIDATKSGVTAAIDGTKTGVTTAIDATKTGMTTAIDATKSGVTAAIDNTKTGVTTAIDATKTSANNYYKGAVGSIAGAWKKRPFQFKKTPPERDYSKIYHKYFAAPATEEETLEIQPNPLVSAILKPWGTVKKYIPNDILAGAEDSYSIGITGYVTEDSTVAEESDSSQTEMDASTAAAIAAADDITVETVEEEAEAEVVEEEVAEDEESVIETSEVEEVPEVAFEAEEIAEVDTEEVPEAVESEDVIDEVVEDEEVVTESVDIYPEELGEDVEVVLEDVPEEVAVTAEDDIEDSSEIAEDVEDTLESEIEIEVVPEDTELEDVEAEVEDEESLEDAEVGSEESPVDLPRKATFFTRLWGTTKTPKTADSVEIDSAETTIEESFDEPTESIDDEETTSDESLRKPGLFSRLWGVSKEPKEIYSLGLQGINDRAEELDVDVSVSIVEEDESLDALEISDSSGVEDIEDEIEEVFEDEEEIAAAVEDTEDDRNVFQLHVPEKEDVLEDSVEVTDTITIEETHAEIEEVFEVEEEMDAAIEDTEPDRNIFQLHEPEIQVVEEDTSVPEVVDTITPSEDTIEEEITTLQLHQDDTVLLSDDVESEMEIAIEEDLEDSVEVEIESEVEQEDLLEESEGEEIEEELIAAESDEEVESEESEEFVELLDEEDSVEEVVVDAFEDEISDESEEVIEAVDDDDEEEVLAPGIPVDVFSDDIEDVDEESLVEVAAEDTLSEEVEDFEEEEELEESMEDEAPLEILEEERFVEEIEMDESEEEEVVYYEEADEDVSSPYSLEVELQSANFVTRFLVNRGLEQVVMFAILISEWFRAYILAPFLESFYWVKKGKAQDLLQTVMKTRGGASALSEAEDEEEIEEEDEGSDRETPTEATDADNTESGALSDSENGTTEQDVPVAEPAEKSAPATPRVPPNFLFRRLLDYGYWGHLLIMEIILAVEWVKTYVPDIHRVSNYIAYDVLRLRKRSRRGPGEPDNLMNAGFVNTGEGSRLGRLPKKMRKKEDQKALAQLQDVGDVNEAKYRFVSTSFLQRHEIGPYNVAVGEVQLEHGGPKKKSSSSKKLVAQDNDDEDESDSGWIMDALGVEKEEEEPDDLGLPFDTSVGVSMGSSGPSVSVGVEFNIGGKKKKKSSSLRSVLESSSGTRKPKKSSAQPRVSDSESGLMGRLRAQGANSLVGRSILGAYPGDLPPPDEAADSRGVIDMAERYGYGDWSDEDDDESDDFAFEAKDDDDDDDDDDDEPFFTDDEIRPKTRSKKKTKAKKRRSSASKSRQNIQIGASIDLGASSQEPPPVTSVSSRKKRRRRTTPASSTTIASSLSGSRPSRKTRTSSSQLPSLAMEKLGTSPAAPRSTTTESTKPTVDTGAKDILSVADKLKSKTETKTLKPAMSLLDKAKKTEETESSNSESDDKSNPNKN